MLTNKETAESLKILYQFDIIDNSVISKWADSVIMKEVDPPYMIIELSLINDKNYPQITTLLSNIEGDIRNNIPKEILYCFLNKKLKNNKSNIYEIVETLWHTSKDLEYLKDDNKIWESFFDELVSAKYTNDSEYARIKLSYKNELKPIRAKVLSMLSEYENKIYDLDWLLKNTF